MNCPICGSEYLKETLENYLKCRRCAIAFSAAPRQELNPSPPSENKEDVYQHSKKILFTEGLKNINKLLPRKGLLLDIGCGHGYFMKYAADNGWRCEGVEISPNAIAYCREKLGLKVYEKPLQNLGLSEKFYDIVTLWGVLDLLPEPKSELDEIYRILKPGGVLFLRVNNFSYHKIFWKVAQTKFFKLLKLQPAIVHRWGINSAALNNLLKNARFEKNTIQNSKPTSGDPYGTGGKLGGLFVSVVKFIYYIFAQAIFYLSLRKFCISSSLLAVAKKPENYE